MRIYPTLSDDSNASLKEVLDFIIRERGRDVQDFGNLPSTFIGGRKVNKIPSGTTDIVGSFVGDFSATTAGVFIAVNESSTVSWRKLTSSTF
jgi:hypothetical protein